LASFSYVAPVGLEKVTLLSEEGDRLALIQAALERLEDGSYGVCAECSGEISARRLNAIPYARFCIECKSAKEAAEYPMLSRRA